MAEAQIGKEKAVTAKVLQELGEREGKLIERRVLDEHVSKAEETKARLEREVVLFAGCVAMACAYYEMDYVDLKVLATDERKLRTYKRMRAMLGLAWVWARGYGDEKAEDDFFASMGEAYGVKVENVERLSAQIENSAVAMSVADVFGLEW